MWQTITGHNRQKEQLKRAIRSNNISHAYLFSGIDGIGKKLTANVAAAALLCTELTDEVVPCGKCPNCQKFQTGTYPDLIQVNPENNRITIDMIRDVKSGLRFSPLEGDRRVIIVDRAELMNANAANAALKILEEPPPGNHFFIITATPSRLLPTIISRCQKLEFSPLTNSELEECLTANHGYSKSQATAAGEISEGSINRALSITPELIDSVTEGLYKILATPTTRGILEISNDWASEKDEIENTLHILHRSFHNALLRKSRGEAENSRETDKLTALIESKNETHRLLDKCSSINRTHSYVTRTYNKQLMFEQLLFTLARK